MSKINWCGILWCGRWSPESYSLRISADFRPMDDLIQFNRVKLFLLNVKMLENKSFTVNFPCLLIASLCYVLVIILCKSVCGMVPQITTDRKKARLIRCTKIRQFKLFVWLWCRLKVIDYDEVWVLLLWSLKYYTYSYNLTTAITISIEFYGTILKKDV